MKSILYVLFSFALITGALLGDQPFVNWTEVVQDAANKEKLVITSGHMGVFGGVYTASYTISLGQNKKGDSALILFNACSHNLHEWASKNGAQHSTTNDSVGYRSLRIKALSGHYLSTIYQPPKQGATQGTFNIVFVEPDEFLQPIDNTTKKPSEQVGGGNASHATP